MPDHHFAYLHVEHCRLVSLNQGKRNRNFHKPLHRACQAFKLELAIYDRSVAFHQEADSESWKDVPSLPNDRGFVNGAAVAMHPNGCDIPSVSSLKDWSTRVACDLLV